MDPLGIVMKAGGWYLVARVGASCRTYRIAKLLDLEVLEEGFERPAGFELAAHWSQDLQRFEASLHRSEAVLRASGAALSQLDRLGAAVAEPIMAALPDAEGWRQALVPIEGVEQAAGMLLGFGAEIEVVSPPALRRRLAELAGRVLRLYEADTGMGRRRRSRS